MASEPSPDYTRMTAPEVLNAVRDDAWKWADAFMQTLGTGVELDHALMVGWFANAIEHSHALRAAAAVRESVPTGWRDEQSDPPPCNDTFALAYWKDGNMSVEDFDHDSDPEWWRVRGLTHWMPLPNPPEPKP